MNGISGLSSLQPPVKHGSSQEFRVGQVIDGVVVEVLEDGLVTVNLSGKTVKVATGSEPLRLGDALRLKITDVGGGSVLAMRVNAKETGILNRLGVSVSSDNLAFISELLQNGQPIDKELLSRLSKQSQEVRTLAELVNSGAEVTDLEEPIRSMVIKLFSQEGAQAKQMPDNTSSAVQMRAQPDASNGGVQGQNSSSTEMGEEFARIHTSTYVDEVHAGAEPRREGKELSRSSEFVVQDHEGSGDEGAQTSVNREGLKEEKTALEWNRERNEQPNMPMSKKEAAYKMLSGTGDRKEMTDAVKTLLNQFDAKDNIALTLNQKTLNLKNIAAVHLDTAALADEFIEVSKALKEISEITAVVKDLESGQDLEQVIKNRYPKLETIAETLKDPVKQENTNIYYIPIPLRVRDEEKRSDLYVKRSKKNERELSVLVSLKTNHLGEVRCLVSQFDRDYILGFALEKDEIADFVREKIGDFKSGIKNLQILIRSREEIETEFFEGKDTMSNCDMRV
ncbi:MAG: hypothetical protein Q4A41_04875 [Bacillota bacterium]|nr:hypothetical protein [Bacillota bacterium]